MVKKNTMLRNIGIILVTLLLMGLIVFLVGRSFGFFQYAKKGDTVNIITINGLAVNITNDSEDNLNLQETYPMYDSEGLTREPLTFTIENTSSRAIDYTLKVENDTEKQAACKLENNDPCPQLATSNIRYAYKIGNGNYSEPQNLGTNDNIILSTTLLGKQTQEISLILWIDSNAGNEIQGQYFFGQLVIEGTKANLVQATLYSAALDEVYYNDSNNQKVVLGTTDATGKLENASIPSQQSITLYSSIAKDPDNLDNPYSKTINPMEINGSIYLMPASGDNMLYWYGYQGSNIEDVTSANGWSYSSYTYKAPTYNTQYISFTSSSHVISGVGTKNPVSGTKIYVIAKGITIVNNHYADIGVESSKNQTYSSESFVTSNSLEKYTYSFSDSKYLFYETDNGRHSELYALWYE